MLRSTCRGLFCLALVIASSMQAHATILTFDITNQVNYNPITTYGTRVNSLSDADGSYLQGNAFTPNVVASYRTVNPADQSTLTNQVDFWNTGYGDLINVAFASSSGYLAEITLTPDAGYGINLNSFDMAGWPNQDYRDQPLVIYDANYNVLVDYSPLLVVGNGHNHLVPAISYAGTIHIQYSSNWDVGMDNVDFDQYSLSAVPEPSTLASAAIASFFGLAAVRARRRRA